MKRTKESFRLRDLCVLALFVAIEFVLKLTNLALIPVGPFKATTLTIPVAIGAMLLGPWQGTVLGLVFGLCSFADAFTSSSMTGIFLQINPFTTALLYIGTRILVGLLTGLLFRALRRIDRTQTVCYYLGALCTALLNTFLFMSCVVLFFYHSEYIQDKVAALGSANPFVFVLAFVGVQGLVEAAVCCLLGGTVAKGVSKALKL